MLGTREYTLCKPFRANAHNSSYLYCFLNNNKYYVFEYVIYLWTNY